MTSRETPEGPTLHQVANLLAIIETQCAVVRATTDEAERARRAVDALGWIEQAGRDTQRMLTAWRQRERGDASG